MDIIFDILKAIKEKNNKIKITHILYKANLSHTNLKLYMAELEDKKLIEPFEEKKTNFYRLTKDGEFHYQKLRQMKNFMETFDI